MLITSYCSDGAVMVTSTPNIGSKHVVRYGKDKKKYEEEVRIEEGVVVVNRKLPSKPGMLR
jgi:hypothetical protein